MKSTSLRLFAALTLTLGTISLSPVAQAQTVAFTPPALGSTSNGNGITTGYTFTVGASPISVTNLGYYDVGLNGLLTTHQITIWNSGGTPLGTGTVLSGVSAPLTGNYRYVSLGGSPISLSANTTYTIGATNLTATAEAIPLSMSAGAVTAASGVSLGAARSTLGENTFPTTDFFNAGHYMTPNFQFTLASSSAPEPGTLAFLALGGTLVLVKRRRLH